MPTGVLLIDKPAGLSSHDVVARVRKLLGERRVGHCGTLDPFATGLLLLCLGRATRLSRFLSSASKSYKATIFFGYATDTYDRTGTPTGAVQGYHPERRALEQLLQQFEGRQEQRPPTFSAKKIRGKRLYQLARAGVEINPPTVEVEIYGIDLLELRGPEALIDVQVSSGTYIRSLAHDIGKILGPGAHLRELRRTRVASFSVADALELESLETKSVGARLLSPNEALRDLPGVSLGREAARRLSHGRAPMWEELNAAGDIHRAAKRIRVLGSAGELLAIGEPDCRNRVLRPILVWDSRR